MAKYTEKGIVFNKVYDGNTKIETSPITVKNTYNVSNGQVSFAGGDMHCLVNAVDIDWNGAQIDSNTELNSTAEVLNWVKNKVDNINIPETNFTQDENSLKLNGSTIYTPILTQGETGP
jgi:hypothetical protein